MAFDFTSRPPRPRKGDNLFKHDLPDELGGHTRLGSNPKAYTLGYRRAAEQLSRYALANQRECSSLAYPIVFLYRHHIELALKRIIYCIRGFEAQSDGSREEESWESPIGPDLG